MAKAIKSHLSLPLPIRITKHDIAMLASIETGRYLMPQALEWLHVASWEQRYRQHLAATQSADSYKPQTYLRDRLKALWQHNLLHRTPAPSRPTDVNYLERGGSTPYIYSLAEDGASLLRRYFHHPDPYVNRTTSITPNALEHAVLIGTFYAALRAKLERTVGACLTGWRGDHLTAQAYDRITVQRQRTDGSIKAETLPVQPDGAFIIKHSQGQIPCFLEIDRGRNSLSWSEKVCAYRHYVNTEALRDLYGVSSFLVLGVTVDPKQRQLIADATATEAAQGYERFLFFLHEHIHPWTIGNAWKRITEAQPQTIRTAGRRRAVTTYSATLADHVLIP